MQSTISKAHDAADFNDILIAAKSLNSDAVFLDFIQAYYHRYQSMRATLGAQDLAGMAVHHFALLKKHTNAPLVQVYNPSDAHQFNSNRTIVQTVAKDRPFLVDTLLMCFESLGVRVLRVHSAILDTKNGIAKADSAGGDNLSLLQFEIDRQDDGELGKIETLLLEKFSTLDLVVNDWEAMRTRLDGIIEELGAQASSNDEVRAFLRWIGDDNFIFLGFREYRVERGQEIDLFAVQGSGLGLLRREDSTDVRSESFAKLPNHLKSLLVEPNLLLLSKSSHVSPVQRRAHMDFLGIQKYQDGELVGEYRFVGLLTSRAYHQSVDSIPLLREKAQMILQNSGAPKNGHLHHKMVHIINTLPRDDLFQASIGELAPMVLGASQLKDKDRLRLFCRIDHYQRFVSCLVYVPKHKFDTNLRQKIQQALVEAFGGISSEFSTDFNEPLHARLAVHVRTVAGDVKTVDVDALEVQLNDMMQDWGDAYQVQLDKLSGAANAHKTMREFFPNISAAYKERFDVQSAVEDTQRLLATTDDKLAWHLLDNSKDSTLQLKVYGKGEIATLSKILPILERFGAQVLSADTYEFGDAWLQEYHLQFNDDIAIDSVRGKFEEALGAIWGGLAESDRLNSLILAGLDYRQVIMLRALSRYIVQAGAPFSTDYVQETLTQNVPIAQALVQLFDAKMNPAHSTHDTQQARAHIDTLLGDVKSLDHDRIIHWFLDLLNAMVRTSFYNKNITDRVSFKFLAKDIPNLPKPKPMFEIYVYSPRTEGVHLRGGKVARGGLRWSDRMEDYRTEVLGLVKAQMVKNAVIVPVGSKGGFVCKDKSMQTDREAWQKEGIACYQTFVRGLLDLTDNLVDGKIVPPADTVRHDEDDPYLVVAADKGTATFSDIANGLSAEYNFWLKDAFASGGSAGYDHKGMGITARGAWESVKRHFRLMNKDIQSEEFAVIGIGDMSGDVFGNGMLLSQKILLKAAFNHLHIFIDPNPTADKSFAERERLFNNRLGWAEYDKSLISQGGGVFHRTDKSIKISDEMKQAFDIDADELTPNELLKALLKAPVDLLWNGGIGTYVKASDEEHSDVGDRANDAIRVNGNEVGAKVIGEGGNLGCTQKGRIEYALAGGKGYTDAIDNSGGVNCSDHEVNIKILLGQVIESDDMNLSERNDLLASMTDEVAHLVLRQNYLQPQAIEISHFEGAQRGGEHIAMMALLEKSGLLARDIEFLPSDEVLNARQKQSKGLTRPELSVLLAYSKMWVYEQMLASDLPQDTYFLQELKKYFPSKLSSYFDKMTTHRLHQEIICTYLTNGLVNRLGSENVFALVAAGHDVATITKAYALVRDAFGLQKLWNALEALDNKVDANLQIQLEIDIRKAMLAGMRYFIAKHGKKVDANDAPKYQKLLQDLAGNQTLASYLQKAQRNTQADLVAQGMEETIAGDFARLAGYASSLQVATLVDSTGKSADEAAQAYFAVADAIALDDISARIEKLPTTSYWERRAAATLRTELARAVMAQAQKATNDGVTEWQATRTEALANLLAQKDALDGNLASLSVYLGEVSAL